MSFLDVRTPRVAHPTAMVSTKMSNAIQNLRWQITHRRTRGHYPQELSQPAIDDLQTKVDALVVQQKKARADRAVERLQRHVTADGDTTRAAVTSDGDATRAAIAGEAAQGRAAAAGSPHYLTRV